MLRRVLTGCAVAAAACDHGHRKNDRRRVWHGLLILPSRSRDALGVPRDLFGPKGADAPKHHRGPQP